MHELHGGVDEHMHKRWRRLGRPLSTSGPHAKPTGGLLLHIQDVAKHVRADLFWSSAFIDWPHVDRFRDCVRSRQKKTPSRSTRVYTPAVCVMVTLLPHGRFDGYTSGSVL